MINLKNLWIPILFLVSLSACQSTPGTGRTNDYESLNANDSHSNTIDPEANFAGTKNAVQYYKEWRDVEKIYAKAIAGNIDHEKIFRYEVTPALTGHDIGTILSDYSNRSSISDACKVKRKNFNKKPWKEPPKISTPDKTISVSASIPGKYKKPIDILKANFELSDQSSLVMSISDLQSYDIDKQKFRNLMLGRKVCNDAIKEQAARAGLKELYIVVGQVYAKRSISGTIRPHQTVSIGALDALTFRYDRGNGQFEIVDKKTTLQFLIYTKVNVNRLPEIKNKANRSPTSSRKMR